MSFLFSAPSPAPAPRYIAPPPAPTPVTPAVAKTTTPAVATDTTAEATKSVDTLPTATTKDEQVAQEKRRKGRKATVLTSAMGAPGKAPGAAKKLFGE